MAHTVIASRCPNGCPKGWVVRSYLHPETAQDIENEGTDNETGLLIWGLTCKTCGYER